MQTTIDMPVAAPKKHSTRFDTTDADAAVSNIYIERWWVHENGGCPNGVRVTIEPIKADD